MNGHDHLNYVNLHPSTAIASPLMNGEPEQQQSAIPAGVVNGEEETLRLLEHGIVDGLVYQQTAQIAAIVENGQGKRPEIINPAQYANMPFGTEVAPGWVWTPKGLKRKRGRPRKDSAVLIEPDPNKKLRKKRKKDETNDIIQSTQHRVIGHDGQFIVYPGQIQERHGDKRQMHHPAPVPVVQVLNHSAVVHAIDASHDDQLQGDKGPEWEVLGHGEIGTIVEQIVQVLHGADGQKGQASGGKETIQEYTGHYANEELGYSDLVETLNVDNRLHSNIELVQSQTTAQKHVESNIASTLEQDLQQDDETMKNNNVVANSPEEAPQLAPVPEPPNTNLSPENITREIQAVLSPHPNTPVPSTPLPDTSVPHTPMFVSPLPNMATPTDSQQPPLPQIDYFHLPSVSTPAHQSSLEEGEIASTPQHAQIPRTPPARILQPRSPPQSPIQLPSPPRTPMPRTPLSPPPVPQPSEISRERASQTLVLDDEGEEMVLPSALNGSSDSNGRGVGPSSDIQTSGIITLPDELTKGREYYESSNHLTSPSSEGPPRTPLNVLLARTGSYYDNDSDIEVEEEPIALRRQRRTENKRRERSPSPPYSRKRQRIDSNSTPANNNTLHTPTPNTDDDIVTLPIEPASISQVDMTAEQPRRRGRQSRKDKNVNRFESVAGLIDLVDE